MNTTVPHSRPWITQEDIQSVAEVLSQGTLAAGEKVRLFESAISAYLSLSHGVAMSSGTAALYTVLAAMGIGEGDEVVIPAYVCAAPLHAVKMTGAAAVLADSGDDGFHVDADTVKTSLTPLTRAVIVPHLFGGTAEIGSIISLGVPVIEDIAMSIGAERNGLKAGNSGSVAAVCSFYATKMLATGEGGMVVTGDAVLAERVRNMISYDNICDNHSHFNFKLTDIAASLGLSQFGRLQLIINRRRELAHRYSDSLSVTRLELPPDMPGEIHVCYRYVIKTGDVDGLKESLGKHGIIAERPVFSPLSLYPGMRAECPHAEETWMKSLSIPLYPSLTDEEADRIIAAVREIDQSMM